MSKAEFLDGLRRALSATGSSSLIEENLVYYNNYIDAEISKGRSEKEVLDELGDPRLIARSIMDAGGYTDSVVEEDARRSSYDKGYNEGYQNRENGGSFHMFRISGWQATLALIVIALVVIGIFYIIGKIIGGIFTLIGPLLGPICMIIAIRWFIKIFRE